MPIISIKLASGRSMEQKQAFVEAVTKCACEHLDVRPEWVTVLFEEFSRENWASDGELHAIKFGQGYGRQGGSEEK